MAAAAPSDRDVMELGSKSAATLSRVFGSLSLDVKQSGTTVFVAGTQVSVEPQINEKGERAGRHILAAEFGVSVGGDSLFELRAGAVGTGDSPDGARDTAVELWANQYGIPIGFAVATRLGASGLPISGDALAKFYAKVDVDGQILFHGPLVIRGEVKAVDEFSASGFIREITSTLGPSMQRKVSSGQQYRSATINLVVKEKAVTDGECRIDGAVAADLLIALSKLTWPEGSPLYMFKLFFVGPTSGG